MGWLTKQMYSRGPGSPGKTCETVVKSYISYQRIGLDEHESCERIIYDYKSVYQLVGIPEIDEFCDTMATFTSGNPALVAFAITLSSHNGNERVLRQLLTDLDTIIEIFDSILNKYNVNVEFTERHNYEWVFENFLKHPDYEDYD